MKNPAILFYTSDFLTGTNLMTDEQVGKYIRLLCYQHQIGHLTEKDMLKICGNYDEDILKKFIKDKEGNYFNKRMEQEITKRNNFSKSRSLNRKGKPNKIKEKLKYDMKNISLSQEQDMENENVNENINENINKYFERFWKAYPKKKSKGDAEKWFKKNKPSKELVDLMIDQIENLKETKDWQKQDGQFIPYPTTWLNAKGWEDEVKKEDDHLEGIFKE